MGRVVLLLSNIKHHEIEKSESKQQNILKKTYVYFDRVKHRVFYELKSITRIEIYTNLIKLTLLTNFI